MTSFAALVLALTTLILGLTLVQVVGEVRDLKGRIERLEDQDRERAEWLKMQGRKS